MSATEEGYIEDLNIDQIIIRRSELDDTQTLDLLRSEEESQVLDVLYNHPKVLKLLEASFLSVTILNADEQIIGCLVFECFPDMITGLNDFQHENLWEDWLYSCFEVDQNITPLNSLWLRYIFVSQAVEGMTEELTLQILQKVFRFVYNSMPELDYLLFHFSKEAQESTYSSEYISPIFSAFFNPLPKLELSDSERGNMNVSSSVLFSHRSHIINTLEIRQALEQDHDDLVEVSNMQSELNTNIYGEYFIAELIANQNENRKAIVAQVGSKAIGLMSLTTEVDYNILAKNFKLETYDNLCTPDFMDAIFLRRHQIKKEKHLQEKFEEEDLARRKLDEELLCNIVANRISLQQYCINNAKDIQKEIQDFIKFSESNIQRVFHSQPQNMVKILAGWLKEFSIRQPSSFFDEYPTDKVDIFGHDIIEVELFLQTLSFFGLHPQYLQGQGQWKDHKKQQMDKNKKKQKRMMMNNTKIRSNKGETEQEIKAPIYFDWKPLEEAFKNFVDMGAQKRTEIRQEMQKQAKKIRLLFCNEDGEKDPSKTQDILEIAQQLGLKELQPNQVESFGWVLECFGNCQYTRETKMVEKKNEDPAALSNLQFNKRRKFTKKEEKEMVQKVMKLATLEQFDGALDLVTLYDETLMRLNLLDSSALKIIVDEQEEKREQRREQAFASLEINDSSNSYYEGVKDQAEKEMMENVPETAKNAVCINIFFMNEHFECRAIDLLPFAMEQFPDMDYIIVTQPYSVEETVLLQNFIPVPRREDTNLEHCLYIYNRQNLIAPYLTLRRSLIEDLEEGGGLINGALNKEELRGDIKDGILNNASTKICFTAFSEDAVIGFFVMTKDVNLEYYQSHFSIQYHMQLDQYALTDHSRVLHSLINPLFMRQRRFMLRELLRLTDKKALYFETYDRTVLPDLFQDLVLVRNRRFPHFLERKFDVEKDEEELEKNRNPVPFQDRDRDPLDEEQSQFALSMITTKMLSVNKVNNNMRIVVVGASDTGISLIETLLSIKYINFPNIFLLAPGGLVNMHVKDPFFQMKSSSIHYNIEELKSLMLDARVTIIDGRMTRFERGSKMVFFQDSEGHALQLNYDVLVLTLGLMDKGNSLIANDPQYKVEGVGEDIKGVYTMDNPYLYQQFGLDKVEGPSLHNEHPLYLMTHKKRPKNIVVYGRSLDTFCFVCSLLKRGHNPDRVILVIPPLGYEHKDVFLSNEDRINYEDSRVNEPDAFIDETVREKVLETVRAAGVAVYDGFHISNAVKLSADADTFYHLKLKKERVKDKNSPELEAQMIITSWHLDIETNIFNTIQDNGLVYNGRLIVRNNFQTTDNSIFACGKLVEFSQRYINFALGKSLRLDKYSGRELGQRLARCVLEYMGVLKELNPEDPEYEEIPTFSMPIGIGGYLPGGLIFYRIEAVSDGMPEDLINSELNREAIISNNLKVVSHSEEEDSKVKKETSTEEGKVEGEGQEEAEVSSPQSNARTADSQTPGEQEEGHEHYLKFEFDNNGIVRRVTYLGTEEIQVSSLTSLIGLSETYLNRLIERSKSGLIENLAEFMSENWAIALYHEWFSLFRHSLKVKVSEDEGVAKLLEDFDSFITEKGFLDRASLNEKNGTVSEELRNEIRNDALDFISRNMNHLPMYYVPGKDF